MLIRRLFFTGVTLLLLATASTFMSGAKNGGLKGSPLNQQGIVSKPLLRIWVHGNDIYPDLVRVNPGTFRLQAENQAAYDISLILEQVADGQAPQHITTISVAQPANRANQILTLSGGEYVFYEQARPEVKGRLIVE
jgi:hypothetical protein